METSTTQITLVYHGQQQEDHSISLQDLLPSLRGYYGLVQKAAHAHGIESGYEIRLYAVTEGSIRIQLRAVASAVQNHAKQITWTAATATQLLMLPTALKDTVELINTKKHLQGSEPIAVQQVTHNNTWNITNLYGETKNVSDVSYQLLEDKDAQRNLTQYVQPLHEQNITNQEVIIESEIQSESSASAQVNFVEKNYFVEIERTQNTSKYETLTGYIQSLNKERKSGTFNIGSKNGKGIHYSLESESIQDLYYESAYDGLVTVHGLVTYDSLGELQSIRIQKIHRVDQPLFPVGPLE